MAKIQIFSVVGKNGIMFSDFLYHNMVALSSHNHELEFNCFMSSKATPPTGWHARESILKQQHTSVNHTVGLNRALDYIDGDYVVFADTDVAMLMPNWDQYLVEKIKEQKIDILGVGHWDNPRGYQKFPIVTFFMAKSQAHLRAKPDLRPNLVEYPNKYGVGANIIKIETQQESDIYGQPVGTIILQDSGWQMPKSYKEAGLRGQTLARGKEYAIKFVPQIWKFGKQLGVCHKSKGTRRRKRVASAFFKSVRAYVKDTHNIEIK